MSMTGHQKAGPERTHRNRHFSRGRAGICTQLLPIKEKTLVSQQERRPLCAISTYPVSIARTPVHDCHATTLTA